MQMVLLLWTILTTWLVESSSLLLVSFSSPKIV